MSPSNIIFITSPFHRWQDIGAHSNSDVRTPYLDALVKHGLTFSTTFAESADPNETRLAHLRPSHTDPSPLPQQLNEAGFETGFVGAWENETSTLNALGFSWLHCPNPISSPISLPGNDQDYISTQIGDQAVRYIQNTQSPFFLYISLNKPQHPFDPPTPWNNMYNPRSLSLPTESEKLSPEDQNNCREELSRYYALITHLDNQIGRILATLSSRGHTNNIIIYSGLRGIDWALEQQNLPTENNLRVPLIISGAPGQRHGETSTNLTKTTDIAPTIMELCSLKLHPEIKSRSLATHLYDPNAPKRNIVSAQWNAQTRYARNERYKLIESSESNALYDIQEDPEETKNLMGIPKHIVHQVKLSQELQTELNKSNNI